MLGNALNCDGHPSNAMATSDVSRSPMHYHTVIMKNSSHDHKTEEKQKSIVRPARRGLPSTRTSFPSPERPRPSAGGTDHGCTAGDRRRSAASYSPDFSTPEGRSRWQDIDVERQPGEIDYTYVRVESIYSGSNTFPAGGCLS